MKISRTWTLLLTIVSVCLSARAQVPEPGSEGRTTLKWLKDYSAVLRQAEKEKKPVLIDFTTDWCGWSKKMDRETFAERGVQRELRSFILIRLNPEATEQNKTISDGFDISDYPTLVVTNYRGEETGRSSGYMDAKEMTEFLQKQFLPFKGSALGYAEIKLPSNDPLFKALALLEGVQAKAPADKGCFQLLDYCTINVLANGSSKHLTRSTFYVADPDKDDVPRPMGFYEPSRGAFRFRSVRILNRRGEGREIDLRLATDENAYSNESVYWNVRRVSLPLPSLKEGQVVDIIEEREEKPVMPGQFYYRWNTGLNILLDSDLTITFPSG